jgi:hypothetical protein
MEEDNKSFDYMKNVSVVLKNIVIEQNSIKEDVIDRFIFELLDGTQVTWKPKKIHEQGMDGFQLRGKAAYTLNDIGNKLRAVAKILQTRGPQKMNIEYSVMQVEKEGKVATYRFITSEKQFDKWQLVEPQQNEFSFNQIDGLNC